MGLYPGQLAPPVDFTDFDPEEKHEPAEELFKLEQELDVPFKDRHYNSSPVISAGNISVEPECDT
jgi:hypothetical protein